LKLQVTSLEMIYFIFSETALSCCSIDNNQPSKKDHPIKNMATG